MIAIFIGNVFTGVIRHMKDVINTYGEAVIGMCASGGCHDTDWNVYVCVQKYTFEV